jgi:hypothetical protein
MDAAASSSSNCDVDRKPRGGLGTGESYAVTAVEKEMLAHVKEAETICAPIEQLNLRRRFDAVLLASNLITVDDPQRRAFLETCKRHADIVVVEGLELGWQPKDGKRSSAI